MTSRPPAVGIVCDRQQRGGYAVHRVGEEYIAAVRDAVGALPLLIPSLDPPLPPEELLSRFDGFLFTGSPSNVAPKLYGGPAPREGVLQDEHRDAVSLPLLRAAIAAAKPVFAICRGFQELNVAFGGTLHQHVQEVPGRSDHREKREATLDEQYEPAHPVTVPADGVLEKLLHQRTFVVNSLHSQGIDKLAPPLRAEALASDGQIEAVSMPSARSFLLGVQWHPEWNWAENAISRALFAAFGDALRATQ